MHKFRWVALISLVTTLGSTAALAAPQCYTSYGGTKPNKLYLYFPTVDDATFPEFGTTIGVPATSPARAFDVSALTSYTGTAAQLRDAIYDVVADDYCEFNVEVLQTTTAPPATHPRRNTVSIGTDDATAAGTLFGLAQNVDSSDATDVDFAHVWAGTYQGTYGGAGGALNGVNSTLERWARSIGGTAAHEAGHNYGLSHGDGLTLAVGEDALTHHIMASGSHFSGEDRAGYRRHFSDHEYAILAANVGLSVQTMWNWHFLNPNAQTASQVRIEFLSTQAALTMSNSYSGSQSPWINPTLSASLGTQTFKGTLYHRYQITWSVGHAWDGHTVGGPGPSPGIPGQVEGGSSFHVGAGFVGVDYNTSAPIIITDVTLLNATGTALALHPRAVSFDSGTLDAGTGAFDLRAINVVGKPLQLKSMSVQLLPRLLSIDAMMPKMTRLMDVRSAPFSAWAPAKNLRPQKTLNKGDILPVRVASLSDTRHVLQRLTAEDCKRGDRLTGPDVANCKPSVYVSLFPATSVYLTAVATDPVAKYWDRKAKRYVKGPLTSQAFLQVVGKHPDLNKNGVDDYIDVVSKKFMDKNRDGIPDEIQRR